MHKVIRGGYGINHLVLDDVGYSCTGSFTCLYLAIVEYN